MIPDKLREVLNHEGIVALATMGKDEPHLVNTWNSYINITEDGRLLIPAGNMSETEANVQRNNNIQMTLGTREVEGSHGPGTGFLIKGSAAFLKDGSDLENMKSKFPWARAVVEIKPDSIKQTL